MMRLGAAPGVGRFNLTEVELFYDVYDKPGQIASRPATAATKTAFRGQLVGIYHSWKIYLRKVFLVSTSLTFFTV